MMQTAARIGLGMLFSLVYLSADATVTFAEAAKPQASLESVYKHCERVYDVPWSLLAAIDRYAELTKSKGQKNAAPYYGFSIDTHAWSGLGNPIANDLNPLTIHLFMGLGMDANHDGLALPWDPVDRVSSLAAWLDSESGEEDADIAIWSLEQDPIAMDRIFNFAKIFAQYGLYPQGNSFPIAKRYNYAVKHTFGAGRSWGGRRIHEGVDIFASYGTPVLACAYGYVELLGWNQYGGWRIGIRDTSNTYYYYAHLSSYIKGLKQGDIVQPGQVIGYVGSTGYGPPGTSGRFPPHLHFGMYRDSGRHEWAFSPSSMLSRWERMPQKVIYPPKGSRPKR